MICAEALLEHGATVVITARKRDAGEAACRRLAEIGPCELIVADLAAEDGVEALARTLGERFDRLHVLVNNAGVTWGASYEEYPASAWWRVLNLDVAAPFRLVQATTPLLTAAGTRDDPARVVNLGSVDGYAVGSFDNFAYAAAKAGLHQLTHVLALRLGPRHITVNAIAPGPVRTDMTARLLDESEERLATANPLGRAAAGRDDIAAALVYLTARGGAYVTGAVIPVDGGFGIATWGVAAAR
jgi:NAD(P)-dependent dehydrogenase (short-subunit alcohol dehydrogenase family)